MLFAWNFIYLVLEGVISIFNRLFNYFNLGQIVLPMIFLMLVYNFILSPIIKQDNLSSKSSNKRSNSSSNAES